MLVEIVISLLLFTPVVTGGSCQKADSFEEEWCYFNTKLDDLKAKVKNQESEFETTKSVIAQHMTDSLYQRNCDVGWVWHSGSCYLFVDQKLNFSDAKSHCENRNASLVHADDEPENTFIKLYILIRNDVSYWLGLTDGVTEGEWRWEDNNELHEDSDFSDWSSGEPNNYGGGEDCAGFYIGKGFTWNDLPCSYKFAPICEVKL